MPADVRRFPVPAHSIPAEQAVLGALLLDPDAWALIESRVVGVDFYERRHQLIFAAIAAVRGDGRTPDIVSVSEQLERTGQAEEVGGLTYVGKLANDTPSAANITTYAAVVRERSMRRRLRKLSVDLTRAIDESPDRPTAELATALQERLTDLQGRMRVGKGLVSTRDLVPELLDDLDRRRDGQQGLAVGLDDFDALTNGLEPGDLVVIAGRPGMGKTALLVSIAAHVATATGVAVFSAEMPSQQLMRRCLALISEMPQGRFRRPEHLTDNDWSRIATAATQLAQRRIWIDETSSPALSHVRAETTALKAREALGLVIVDYLGLVTGAGANRYEQLRDVAYGFKALAKDLGVPVIVLAQLNRGVESRDHKRPHLSDLRDSGAIEEAADIVGLLYSEGYYDRNFGMPYVLECAIEKNRNGERGQCLWQFDGAQSRIAPLDDRARAQYRHLLSVPQKRGAGVEL